MFGDCFNSFYDGIMGLGITKVIKHERSRPYLTNRIGNRLPINIGSRAMNRFKK